MEQRTLVRVRTVSRCQCRTSIRSVKLEFGCQRYLGIWTDGVLKSRKGRPFFMTVKGSRVEALAPRASGVLDPRAGPSKGLLARATASCSSLFEARSQAQERKVFLVGESVNATIPTLLRLPFLPSLLPSLAATRGFSSRVRAKLGRACPRVIKTRTAIGHSVMKMGISIINIRSPYKYHQWIAGGFCNENYTKHDIILIIINDCNEKEFCI